MRSVERSREYSGGRRRRSQSLPICKTWFALSLSSDAHLCVRWSDSVLTLAEASLWLGSQVARRRRGHLGRAPTLRPLWRIRSCAASRPPRGASSVVLFSPTPGWLLSEPIHIRADSLSLRVFSLWAPGRAPPGTSRIGGSPTRQRLLARMPWFSVETSARHDAPHSGSGPAGIRVGGQALGM